MMEIMQFLLKTYTVLKSLIVSTSKNKTQLLPITSPNITVMLTRPQGSRPRPKDTRPRLKTKTEKFGLKTKTIGPITTYSLPTVNEIIFYSTIFYNLCTLSTS